MKFFFTHRLLGFVAALVFFVGLTAPLGAQQAVSGTDIVSLVRTTDALVALKSSGELLRSTNNGASFVPVPAADSTLYTLGVSGDTVVAMGDATKFVHSTDGGQTFGDRASALADFVGTGAIYSLAAEGTNWAAVGVMNGKIMVLFSSNEGVTWAPAPGVPSLNGVLNGVAATGDAEKPWIAVGQNDSFATPGLILTYNAGSETWSVETADVPLYSVASNGAGAITAVGDEGRILRGSVVGGFSAIDDGVVSENLRSIIYVSGSNWVIGGESAVIVTMDGVDDVNGTDPTIAKQASLTPTAPITALVKNEDGTGYLYYSDDTGSEPDPEPEPHGPISLQIAVVAGQLQLTLTGAENGNSYQLETSTTLTSWTAVPDSTVAYDGSTAPSWTVALPVDGRVFYRANVATP